MLASVSVAGIALAARAADQAIQGPQTQWRESNKCNQDAFKKFPDYTPEANLQREAFRRDCMRDLHIAAPDTPLPPASGAGAGAGQ